MEMKRRKKPLFLRRDWNKKLKLGGRRKKLRWRRAKGRDAQTRLKRKGYSKSPGIGYGMPKAIRGLVKGKRPMAITEIADLEKLREEGEKSIGIIASKIGKRKRVEIAAKAAEKKLKFVNFNPEKFLEKIKEEQSKKKGGKEEGKEEKKTAEKGKEKQEKDEAKKVEEKEGKEKGESKEEIAEKREESKEEK